MCRSTDQSLACILQYPLYTVTVVDEFGHGVPVFWFFTQKETAGAIGFALAAFKEAVRSVPGGVHPDWQPACALTDDSAAEQKALRCE